MPNRHERSSEKKFVRTPGGKTKIRYFKGKAKKQHCALCKGILAGVPHSLRRNGISKLSKTQKRPQVPFGGILCSACRVKVFEETIKIKQKIKPMNQVSFRVKNFVEQALQKVEY